MSAVIAEPTAQELAANRLTEAEVNEALGIRITPVPLSEIGNDEYLVVDEITKLPSDPLNSEIYRWMMSSRDKTIGDMETQVDALLAFAFGNPHLKFYVTPVGCGAPWGRGSFTPADIAPLFFGGNIPLPDNVWLPKEFWDVRKLVYPPKPPKPLPAMSGFGISMPPIIASGSGNSTGLALAPNPIRYTAAIDPAMLWDIVEVRSTKGYTAWGDILEAVFSDGTMFCHQLSPWHDNARDNYTFTNLKGAMLCLPISFCEYITYERAKLGAGSVVCNGYTFTQTGPTTIEYAPVTQP